MPGTGSITVAFADLQWSACAERDGWQVGGVYLQYGDVGAFVGTQHGGHILAPVFQLDDDFICVVDHMRIGHDDAV